MVRFFIMQYFKNFKKKFHAVFQKFSYSTVWVSSKFSIIAFVSNLLLCRRCKMCNEARRTNSNKNIVMSEIELSDTKRFRIDQN